MIQKNKTVYEFHGCFFHGCPKCLPRQRHKKHNCHAHRTISEVYEATCMKTNLRNAGYKVVEKWEHDFEVDKKNNPAVIQFLKTFELIEPLNPRDSFFGFEPMACDYIVRHRKEKKYGMRISTPFNHS